VRRGNVREVTIGGKPYQLAATVMSMWFYREEFSEPGQPKADIMRDVFDLALQVIPPEVSLTDLRDPKVLEAAMERANIFAVMDATMPILQAAWAMAKAGAYPDNFPGYVEWLSGLGYVDHVDLMAPVFEEAVAGFRGGTAAPLQGAPRPRP
jgi:hypothetical protein